jgi:hypothetical protein
MRRVAGIMISADHLNFAVKLAGLGQLLLVIVSPAIPRVLRWCEDVAQLRPLTRQVFWTYSLYTWMTNFWFALVSLLLSRQLLGQTTLAVAITGFMAAYWTGRIAIQFFYYDRGDAPGIPIVRTAETLLVLLFAYLAIVFAAATLFNLRLL